MANQLQDHSQNTCKTKPNEVMLIETRDKLARAIECTQNSTAQLSVLNSLTDAAGGGDVETLSWAVSNPGDLLRRYGVMRRICVGYIDSRHQARELLETCLTNVETSHHP